MLTMHGLFEGSQLAKCRAKRVIPVRKGIYLLSLDNDPDCCPSSWRKLVRFPINEVPGTLTTTHSFKNKTADKETDFNKCLQRSVICLQRQLQHQWIPTARITPQLK